MIRKEIKKGVKNIHVINVNGQYYIGAGMKSNNSTRIMIDEFREMTWLYLWMVLR
jgi:hypothetical protein